MLMLKVAAVVVLFLCNVDYKKMKDIDKKKSAGLFLIVWDSKIIVALRKMMVNNNLIADQLEAIKLLC